MLLQKCTHLNMVEIVVWAILLIAAAVALVTGVLSSDWLGPVPTYTTRPDMPLPFG